MCSCSRLDDMDVPGLVRWVVESDDGVVTSIKPMPRNAVVIDLDRLPDMLADPTVLGPDLRERIREAVR